MKKLGITDAEKKLLFIVLALGLLAASYFLIFTKLKDETANIVASNEQDAATLSQLEGMVARQAETVAETEGFKKSIDDVIKKYPSALPQEKTIYLIQTSQDILGVDHSSISFSMKNVISTIEDQGKTLEGCYAALNLPYTATYEQLKSLLDYTAMQDDRTVIPTLTVNFDKTTGNLMGSLTYRMYYLTNTDKQYEPFPETGIPSGTTDIFHSEQMTELIVIEED